MINNINTLQHLTEGSYMTTYSDIYLKQSLANLGQRYSIKGDGIQTGEFNIYELFNGSYDEYQNAYSYVAVNVTGEVSDPNIVISYIDNNVVIDRIPLHGTAYYRTNESISITGTPINGVDHYKKNGLIYSKNDLFNTVFVGVDKSEDIVEIESNSFELFQHNDIVPHYDLNSALRIRYNSNKTGIYAHLLKFKQTTPSSYHNYIYTSYVFDKTKVSNIDDVEQLLFGTDGSAIIQGNENKISPEYIVDQLLENNIITSEYSIGEDPIALNGSVVSSVTGTNNTVVFTAVNKDNPSDTDKLSFSILLDLLPMYARDINVFYPFIRNYYNDHIYFSANDNLKLKKELFVAIVKKLYEYYVNNSIYISENEFNMWMPYNYKFIYSCSDNNSSKIYNSIHSITTEYTINIEEKIATIIGGDPQQIIICESTDEINIEDKIGVYQYSVIYSSDDIIDRIVVDRTYTLPYIDNNGYWCINDITTDIYAKGKDGGQPNIIITYTDTAHINTSGTHYQVLSSFKRDEITNLDWSYTKCMVKPLDADNNVGLTRYHMMNTMMPTNISYLNENLITFLENAVILNINSVNSESFSEVNNTTYLYENLGTSGVVPTFWVLQKVKKTGHTGSSISDYDYKFSYVMQPNEPWAVDMNYLSNAEKIVKHYINLGIEPDNYEHSWLVFDSVATDLKNSTSMQNEIIWPVIRNLSREDLLNVFGYGPNYDDKYNNDLTLSIGFYNNVSKTEKTGYITGIDQSDTRYFYLDEQGKTAGVINYLQYPEEYIPNPRYASSEHSYNGLTPMFDLSEVFVQNETVLNRLNILSVDQDKNVYNAYYGVSYSSPIKTIIHLGTSYTNPNIGTRTLFAYNGTQNTYFQRHTQLSIDYDYVTLGENFIVDKPIWTKTDTVYGTAFSAICNPTDVAYNECLKKIDNLSEATDRLFSYKEIETFSGTIYAPEPLIHKISYLNLTYYLNNYIQLNICSYTDDDFTYKPTTVISEHSNIFSTLSEDNKHIKVSYFLQLRNNPLSIVTSNKYKCNAYAVADPINLTYYDYDTNDIGDNSKALLISVNELATFDLNPLYDTETL